MGIAGFDMVSIRELEPLLPHGFNRQLIEGGDWLPEDKS